MIEFRDIFVQSFLRNSLVVLQCRLSFDRNLSVEDVSPFSADV